MANRKQNGAHDAHLDDLKKDLAALQRDMLRLIDKVGASAGDQIAAASNGAAHRVEEWAGESTNSVREMIRSQPLAAIALSMSAGAALSLFLRRS